MVTEQKLPRRLTHVLRRYPLAARGALIGVALFSAACTLAPYSEYREEVSFQEYLADANPAKLADAPDLTELRKTMMMAVKGLFALAGLCFFLSGVPSSYLFEATTTGVILQLTFTVLASLEYPGYLSGAGVFKDGLVLVFLVGGVRAAVLYNRAVRELAEKYGLTPEQVVRGDLG